MALQEAIQLLWELIWGYWEKGMLEQADIKETFLLPNSWARFICRKPQGVGGRHSDAGPSRCGLSLEGMSC